MLLQLASLCVVETAPKAQAKTTWWHDVVDNRIDVLVLPQSAGVQADLVLSSFCLSLGMESDSVFHDLFVGMRLMPYLSAVLPIPSLNAFPVHHANQVFLCPKMVVFSLTSNQKAISPQLGAAGLNLELGQHM